MRIKKRSLLVALIVLPLLFACGQKSADLGDLSDTGAQLPVTVGTAGSPASLDTNFGNIQANISELYGEVAGLGADDIAFVPAGDITSSDTQNAIEELDAKTVKSSSLNSAIASHSDVQVNSAKVSYDSTTSARLINTSGTNTGDQDLSGKQDTLVSGTNIKTINSTSILGSGDIEITGSVTVVQTTDGESTTAVPSEDAVGAALDGKQDKLAEGAFVDGDKTKLDGIESGATADQDLSGYAQTSSLGTASTADTGTAISNIPLLVDDGSGNPALNFALFGASGFSGIFSISDDTFQEVFDKIDQLTASTVAGLFSGAGDYLKADGTTGTPAGGSGCTVGSTVPDRNDSGSNGDCIWYAGTMYQYDVDHWETAWSSTDDLTATYDISGWTITDTTGTGSIFTVDSTAYDVTDSPITINGLAGGDSLTFTADSTETAECTGTGLTGTTPNYTLPSADINDLACTVSAAGSSYASIVFYSNADTVNAGGTVQAQKAADATAGTITFSSAITSETGVAPQIGSVWDNNDDGYDSVAIPITDNIDVTDSRIGFYWNPTEDAAGWVCFFDDADEFSIERLNSTQWTVRVNSSNSTIGHGITSFDGTTPVFIELAFTSSDIELFVDGSSVGSTGSGVTISASTEFMLGSPNGNQQDATYDQLIISNDSTEDIYALRNITDFN